MPSYQFYYTRDCLNLTYLIVCCGIPVVVCVCLPVELSIDDVYARVVAWFL
jgi:hypothetical protein